MVDNRFSDGKEPDALRTIGEVAQALGIKQHVLRYWEQQFPMLKPLKRSGGRRYYRSEDVRMLDTIDRLVNREGYTLKGARLVFTGILSVQRSVAMKAARRAGAIVQHGLSAQTTVLVRGKPNPLQAAGREGGRKLLEIKRLREKGIRIALLSETRFWKLVGGQQAGPRPKR